MEKKIKVSWFYESVLLVVTCKPLAPPARARIKYYRNPNHYAYYPDGTTAEYRCYPGYEIRGYVQRVCHRGRWQFESPTCIG